MDQSIKMKYHVGPKRSITIFGGYPVREVIDPDGRVCLTVAILDGEDGLKALDELVAKLNHE